MDVSVFLQLLCGASILSSVITEFVKQFFKNKEKASYNLIALIVGVVVGIGSCHSYYSLNCISFENQGMLISILMGIATAISSMIGYDKVKQLINQLMGK